MEDAILDVVINKINVTLGEETPKPESLLRENAAELDQLEKNISKVQSKLILLKDQLCVKATPVSPHEWKIIDEVASNVETIVDEYEYFLVKGENRDWPNIINDLIVRISKVKISDLSLEDNRGWVERTNLGSNVVIRNHSEEVASLAHKNDMLALHRFNELPSHLKLCTLYCGLLPKDHFIKRKWIIGLWIAEGFVIERSYTTKSLEEIGEDYIHELVEYSLVKVIEKDVCGRIKNFTVPDHIREIALREKFGVVLDSSKVSDLAHDVQRVFVEKVNGEFEFGTTSNWLKSILLFDPPSGKSKDKTLLSWNKHTSTNYKSLRILCLRYAKIVAVHDCIYELYNLECLDLASTKVKIIGRLVQKLKKLKTLNLKQTNVTRLPKEIQWLEFLRHLYVAPIVSGWFSMVVGDNCELKNLQTLKKIKATRNIVKRLPILKKLNNLFIVEVESCLAEELWSSLSEMSCLNTLAISITTHVENVLSLKNIKLQENMEKFYLNGRLEEINPTTFEHLGKLKDFRMVRSVLKIDPLNSLSKMNGLVNLFLDIAYMGDKLIFRDGWFPNLKELHLCRMPLYDIEIMNGTMANLKCLRFSMLSNLKVPDNLRCLRTLVDIKLFKMEEDFGRMLGGRVETTVKITSVTSIQ